MDKQLVFRNAVCISHSLQLFNENKCQQHNVTLIEQCLDSMGKARNPHLLWRVTSSCVCSHSSLHHASCLQLVGGSRLLAHDCQ
jgi:hypothetical protein